MESYLRDHTSLVDTSVVTLDWDRKGGLEDVSGHLSASGYHCGFSHLCHRLARLKVPMAQDLLHIMKNDAVLFGILLR